MTEDNDNVIHVAFGPGGGRRVEPPAPESPVASEPPPAIAEPERQRDPIAALYSASEVARLFSVGESRLRYWSRTGLLEPSGRAGKRRYYTFQDLIEIRTARALLDQGVPLRGVRRTVEALRTSLPRVTRPLSELRIVADGQRVVVRGDKRPFEAATGQLVLDFDVSDLRDDVVRLLRASARNADDRRAAYEHYLEGCRFDEDETTFERAETAYRRAMELDPSLSNAITNLGNLRYRRGFVEEAARLYERALVVDPDQPEALYNLGFLRYERGEAAVAIQWFQRAIEHDPSFADAHFNAAMALEDLGRTAEARAHWETYLRLEPAGAWAEVARRHLGA